MSSHCLPIVPEDGAGPLELAGVGALPEVPGELEGEVAVRAAGRRKSQGNQGHGRRVSKRARASAVAPESSSAVPPEPHQGLAAPQLGLLPDIPQDEGNAGALLPDIPQEGMSSTAAPPASSSATPLASHHALPAPPPALHIWGEAIRLRIGRNSKVRTMVLRVATDCDGIGAPLEALRILEQLGLLGGFVHAMGSELDPATRAFTWARHGRPALYVADMTQKRSLPAGIDVYICGFPCCPYSKRRVALQDPFKDPKARVFFHTVRAIAAIGPKMFMLENVEGLESVYTTQRGVRMTCLQFILRHLKRSLPDYLIIIVPPRLSTPLAHGAQIHRPREYLLGVKQAFCKHPDEDALRFFVHTAVVDINGDSVRRVQAWGVKSFIDMLSEQVEAPPLLPIEYVHCGCSALVSCSAHPCLAPGCRCSSGAPCDWRAAHHARWQELGLESTEAPYFKHMASLGIDASRELLSPRQRDLVNLVFVRQGCRGRARVAVMDVSQSIDRCQFRSDGRVPTVATTSRLFALGLGRFLQREELFLLMGFEPIQDLQQLSTSTAARFIGNSMHVGVVAILLAVLLECV